VVVLLMLLSALLAGAAVAVGAMVVGRQAKAVSSRPDSVAVSLEGFDDARQVTLTVTQGPELAVDARAEGILIWTACEPGLQLASAAPVFRVRSAQGTTTTVALSTQLPWTRPVGRLDRGAAVADVHAALVAAGALADNPGEAFTDASWRALTALVEVSEEADQIPASALLWLPESPMSWQSCASPRGSRVAMDQRIGGLTSVTAFSVDPTAVGSIEGPRHIVVEDIEVVVEDDRVTSQPDIAALMGTAAYSQWRLTGGQVPIVGTYRLAETLEVGVVPASAVLPGTAAPCVISDSGTAVSVTVVSSRLGRTLVEFSGGSAPSAVRIDPDVASRCP